MKRKLNPLAALSDQRRLWLDLFDALAAKGVPDEQVATLRAIHSELETLTEPVVKAQKWNNS